MDFTKCEPVTVLKTRKKKKHDLLSVSVHIDTETSKHIEYQDGKATVAYGWVYVYGLEFAGQYHEGRTVRDMMDTLDAIRDWYGCSEEGTHIVVYIHNLSYDIQYMKDWMMDRYGGDYTMLATATHKFITFSINAYEFRCSYRLSNVNLATWAKNLGVEHQKQVGEIDYKEVHYQDEELPGEQHHYLYYDVWTLRDCVRKQLELYGDNLQTVPLTSTGYVRRITRKNFKKRPGAVEQFRKRQLTAETYSFCSREFSGGLTHGNRFMMGKIIHGTIRHADFDSHYPTQQRARIYGFPCSRFSLYYDENDTKRGMDMTIPQLLEYAHNHCLLIEIAIRNLKVKKGVTLPYAQASKFIDGRRDDWKRPILDNGRILQSFGTSVVVYNEIDLTILYTDYDFQYTILKVYSAKRGAVPEHIKETVDSFYSEKTRLKKHVEELKTTGADPLEIEEAKRELLRVKQLLNSVYGMTATRCVREEYTMDTLGNWSVETITKESLKQKLYDYYGNFNSFNEYQLGCWTTSLARYQLWYVVRNIIGYENFIYADTDSAFYISTPEIEQRLKDYNEHIHTKAIEHGAYITLQDGTVKAYDRFADEGENISDFVFLHAKAYSYIADGELSVTVAGVPWRTNGVSRVEELGSIENFKPGFVFKINGGTRAIYTEERPHTIMENGHKIELASACLIEETEKTLNDDLSKGGWIYDESDFELL